MRNPIAVAMLLFSCIFECRPAVAQHATPTSPNLYVPTMTFDTSSVRVSDQDPNLPRMVGGSFRPHSTDLHIGNVGFNWIVTMAYGVDLHRVQGLPAWDSTSFNIEAKSDAEADAKLAILTDEQQQAEQHHMLQALLADRFHLQAHWETMEKPVYLLIIGKSGSRLRPEGSMTPDASEVSWMGNHPVPPLHQQGDGRNGYMFYGHSCPMESLTAMLGAQMGRDIVDETGLTGKFDFLLKYSGRTERDNDNDDPTHWPPIIDAVQDQLGLRLKPGKGMVKVLMIDHVEMPTPN